MSNLLDMILSFHCKGVCPHKSCIIGVVRGLRNGVVYGARIRFPHALVMTILFRRSGPIKKSILWILRVTFEHSRNLGFFVALFKFIQCLMRHLLQRKHPLNSLVAGAIGGAAIFGTETAILSQINMYVFSRVCHAIVSAAQTYEFPLAPRFDWNYRIYAAVIWALVMYFFEFEKPHLVRSLQSSMEYLYHNERDPQNVGLFEWLKEIGSTRLNSSHVEKSRMPS
eukprot:688629_1